MSGRDAPPATRPDHRPTPGRGLLQVACFVGVLALVLPWQTDPEHSGATLAGSVLDTLFRGEERFLLGRDPWSAFAVGAASLALFVLGLLLVLRPRWQRVVGGLALLAGLATSAALIAPLHRASWETTGIGLGFWLALAVPALGLLGGLAALLAGSHSPGEPAS